MKQKFSTINFQFSILLCVMHCTSFLVPQIMRAQTSSGTTIVMSDPAPPASGTGWTYASDAYIILDGANVTVTGSNQAPAASQRRIAVAVNATVSITLDNANITGMDYMLCPLLLSNGANVTLTITGTNTLTGGNNCAGIQVLEGTAITIDGTGTLNATGGDWGAGIGSANARKVGTITINSGTVFANGGSEGAGIGGGITESGGNITINGGTVNATGGMVAAGIGGGYGGASGVILITGNANVTSTGGNSDSNRGGGAGIGSGGTPITLPANVNSITITTTGTVNATGGAGASVYGRGADIGEGGYAGRNGAPWYAINISAQPDPATALMAGSIAGNLSVTANLTPAPTTIPLNYQWYSNTANSNTGGMAVSGATSATFAIPATLAVGTYYYYCVVSARYATDMPSNVATVTVMLQPTVSLVGAAPAGAQGAVGAQTVTVAVAGSYNEIIHFVCDVNGITKTDSRSGDGDVSFAFTAAELDALATGSYPITVSSAATTYNDDIAGTVVGSLTVTTPPLPPDIAGPASMTLTEGYAATSTGVYAVSGDMPVSVAKLSGDDHITWNSATNRLDIAEGLPPGVYPVVLTAGNGVAPDATLTFTLTVTPPVYAVNTGLYTGGKATVDKSYAFAGETVTLTVTPAKDCRLADLSVYPSNSPDDLIPLNGTDNIRTFTMPACDVTVTATFVKTGWEYARAIIEETVFTVPQDKAGDADAVRFLLANMINEMIVATGYVVSHYDIFVFSFQSAVSGYADSPAGTDGAFSFRVSPSGFSNSAYASGVITPTSHGVVSNDVVEAQRATSLQAYVANGTLYVSGLTPGQPCRVYNISGMSIYRGIADANAGKSLALPLPARGVYIVTDGNGSVKVVF